MNIVLINEMDNVVGALVSETASKRTLIHFAQAIYEIWESAKEEDVTYTEYLIKCAPKNITFTFEVCQFDI